MNPLFDGWYADPEIHLFGGRYYIYPTCSRAYEDQTCFEVWCSADLVDWRNEGTILDFADVPWSSNRAAWAPSATEHEGRYYLYFSAGDGAGIGVAVADQPTGPFVDALGHALISEYHHGAQPIDAHAFKDDDGRNYLYYGGWREAVVVELGPDMISTTGDFNRITPENYVEGPFMVKRGGVYYFMWSEGSWGDETYSVAYGRSSSPLGPFEREGVVLKSNPKIGNSAGHHSVLQIPGTDDWYIAYHRRPITESARDRRVVCLDRMFFDESGRILPVELTSCGVPRRPII
jgi:beta-xylosidase